MGPWWWWDPWLSPWYDPFWWGPVGYNYPNYDYPPPDDNYPPPYGPEDNNGPNADLQAEPLPPAQGEAFSQVQPEAPPDTNSYSNTANVAESTPSILLYLKDGTTLVAWDYWVAEGKLHYTLRYGGESALDMNDLDLQRTVDENAKRGIQFRLKPQPMLSTPPATTQEATPSAAAA